MDAVAGDCRFCGEPVARGSGFRAVSGWEREFRNEGGGNKQLALRKRHEWVAHRECVETEQRGRRGQTNLLE